MKKFLALFFLICGSSISYAKGTIGGIDPLPPEYMPWGPESCLKENESCPIWFLQDIICHIDKSVCLYDKSINRYRFVTRLFSDKYADVYKDSSLPVGQNNISSVKELQTLIDHEMYEYVICYKEQSLCYFNYDECPDERSCPEGHGWQIYLYGLNWKPSDAKVCQRMPDACSSSTRPH